MNKQKGFAPLIIILIIVVLGVAGYFTYKNYYVKLIFTPMPIISSDVSTWSTYSDKAYLYSIKYPKGWYVDNSTKNEVHISNFIEAQLSDQERKDVLGGIKKDVVSITLGVYGENITNGESLLSWLKTNDQYISGMSGAPTSVKQTVIAGNPGLILDYTGTGLFYVFSVDSHVYYTFSSANDSRFDQIFSQILSSFTITK